MTPYLEGRPLPIFPCYANKRPACANGFRDATTDPARIRELWAGRTGLLVAVPTGEASGISVLDVDDASWPGLGELPPTRIHQTRSWLGAQDCRYDRNHGTTATLRLIRRGMLAGMRLPYPDLEMKVAV